MTLAVVLIVAGCGSQPQAEPKAQAPVAVRTTPVVSGPLERRIDYIGSVHAKRQVRVIARVPGTVGHLVAEGERVKAGQPVAIVLAPELNARRNRTQAELARARTERNFLCEKLATDKSLNAAGALPTAVVDASQRACSSATAAVDAAEAGLQEVDSQASKGTERSPFAGHSLAWLSEPGQNVMPGMPLLLVGDEAREVRVRLAETDVLLGVEAGSPVMVEIGSQRHTTTIREVAPIAAGPARTVEARIDLPNSMSTIARPGQSVRVGIVMQRVYEALIVPSRAIVEVDGHAVVYAIAHGKARRVEVTQILAAEGKAAVQGALEAGALVAVTNTGVLKNETRVYPVPSRER